MTGTPDITISPALDDLDEVRRLFSEYAAMLGIDLAFQNFDGELTALPGKYAPPSGIIHIARPSPNGGRAAGCVALRPFDAGRCEMKRLFVREEFRGQGIGRLLAERIVADARVIGYRSMLLDTLESLPEAVALYTKMGFNRIAPYCHNPQPDAVFMEKVF